MNQRRRWMLYRFEVAAATVSALLFVLALIDPQWIERLFGVAPDDGDSSLERWLVLTSSFVVATIAASLARRGRRLLQAPSRHAELRRTGRLGYVAADAGRTGSDRIPAPLLLVPRPHGRAGRLAPGIAARHDLRCGIPCTAVQHDTAR